MLRRKANKLTTVHKLKKKKKKWKEESIILSILLRGQSKAVVLLSYRLYN